MTAVDRWAPDGPQGQGGATATGDPDRARARRAPSGGAGRHAAPAPSAAEPGTLAPGSPGSSAFRGHGRPTGPVSPMLVRLAKERATGALLRDRGTLYLSEGGVVHAESPAAPGMDVLLTVGGRLPREEWQRAVDRAGAHRRVARDLVDAGHLASGELELCHVGALFDAAFFALAPGSGPSRFRYGAAHWLGTVRPVSAAAVERETLRRRALLQEVWPYETVDAAPVVARPAEPGQPVTRRQRAVLRLADGTRTPSSIAWELGRPAFHTLLEIRRLAAAGLVETPPAATGPRPTVPSWVATLAEEPDIALLRRLRDALEAL